MSKLQKIVKDKGAWHPAVHGVTKSWISEKAKESHKQKYDTGISYLKP